MAREPFRPKLAATREPLSFEPTSFTFGYAKDVFKFQTLVLFGALAQTAITLVLPLRWAVVPPSVLLLNTVITTLLQARNPLSNEYQKRVVRGRVSAQVPSLSTAATGLYSSEPAEASIVVFNIGAQFNHPLGPLAPGVKEMGDMFYSMKQDLLRRREELGVLSISAWTGDERMSNNTNMLTIFFRDVARLHQFAHEDLHRKAWDWLSTHRHEHIGVFHETYEVPAKSYETVYLNCRPILLGSAAVKLGKDGDAPKWSNTLVNANTPALKTQYSRMGRDKMGNMTSGHEGESDLEGDEVYPFAYPETD